MSGRTSCRRFQTLDVRDHVVIWLLLFIVFVTFLSDRNVEQN